MAIFMLVVKNPVIQGNDHQIQSKLNSTYNQDNVKKICEGQYLIASNEILVPEGIADTLGEDFGKGSMGSFIIVPVTAYWGFHDRSIWAWLTEKGI